LKQKIYTIPINEAFDSGGEAIKGCICPFCAIAERLDNEAVEYTLGAAMMEPDFRITTNEKGFCGEHISKLTAQTKALPLALIMQSQSALWNERLSSFGAWDKKKLFGKSDLKDTAAKLSAAANGFLSSCAICDKVEHTMSMFFENTIYIWKTESQFREKFSSKSFCLKHFSALVTHGASGLGEKDFETFYTELYEAQMSFLGSVHDDVSEFTKLFDHRSGKELPPQEVKSALKRAVHVYSDVKR